MGPGCRRAVSSYSSPQVVVVRDGRLGTAYRALQILVLYVFVVQKGYQERETGPESSVITKVKGVTQSPSKVWDVGEYVAPPEVSSDSAAPVMLGSSWLCCDRRPPLGAACHSEQDCVPGAMDASHHGVRTGRCVPGGSGRSCEVLAWCPLHGGSSRYSESLAEMAAQFTILIKNHIRFPRFGFSKANIQAAKSHYLKSCTFNATSALYCPIFRLGFLAEQAGEDFTVLAEKGGVIGVIISWDCNLDLPDTECNPRYSFRRLDPRGTLASPGYNYRFAKYYSWNGTCTRVLTKAYGIRVDVIVQGQGSFLCDWVLLCCMDKERRYSSRKFEQVPWLRGEAGCGVRGGLQHAEPQGLWGTPQSQVGCTAGVEDPTLLPQGCAVGQQGLHHSALRLSPREALPSPGCSPLGLSYQQYGLSQTLTQLHKAAIALGAGSAAPPARLIWK
uniref:P2X purinoceptor n=1 Tax=Pavo cristatus TaxID=9049 RepID=A0A8C9L7H6_PAVCR